MSKSIPNKQVLLIGCTNGVGKFCAYELLVNTSYNVVLMSRSKDKALRVIQQMVKESKDSKSVENHLKQFKERFTVVEGDLTDESSFDSIFKNNTIDTILCCASATKGWTTLSDKRSPYYVDYLGTKNMIEYSHKHGVNSFILVSSAKVTQSFSLPYILLNTLFGRVMWWKRQAEECLAKIYKDRNYLIVRPGGLIDKDELKNEIKISMGDNDSSLSRIPRRDVAQFCVNSIGRYETKFKNGSLELSSTSIPAKQNENNWLIDYDHCFDNLKN